MGNQSRCRASDLGVWLQHNVTSQHSSCPQSWGWEGEGQVVLGEIEPAKAATLTSRHGGAYFFRA